MRDASEDEFYAAMDWLIERQGAIEKRLARRHLKDGGLVLFDLTSSYFEGVTCPLAKIGCSRDGKRGTLQVDYRLLTDARGCPVSVSVFEGRPGARAVAVAKSGHGAADRQRAHRSTLVYICGQRNCWPHPPPSINGNVRLWESTRHGEISISRYRLPST
jgi:hypothetical protein